MKRHPVDLFSLITGLAFVTIAVLYLLDASGQLKVNGRLVIPLLLIALGFGGLAGALLRMVRGAGPAAPPEARPETPPEPAQAPVGGPYRYDDLSPDLEAMGLLDDRPKGSSEP